MGQRIGGRQKGTPNKDKQALLQLVRDAVGDQDYHPVVEMAKTAHRLGQTILTHAGDIEGQLTLAEMEKLKQMAEREVAQYVAPKLKAIEHSGRVALPTMTIKD